MIMEPMKTLSQKIDALKEEGYTENFSFQKGKLSNQDRLFSASDISEVKEYRFEGKSNPDDLSILYQITTKSGLKGTISDGFGPSANPELSQFILKAES